MSTIKVITGRNRSIKVVASSEQKEFISSHDAEMDARAAQAVKSAVAKAEFCKKPVARYDITTKKVYVEYADGEKKYVN